VCIRLTQRDFSSEFRCLNDRNATICSTYPSIAQKEKTAKNVVQLTIKNDSKSEEKSEFHATAFVFYLQQKKIELHMGKTFSGTFYHRLY